MKFEHFITIKSSELDSLIWERKISQNENNLRIDEEKIGWLKLRNRKLHCLNWRWCDFDHKVILLFIQNEQTGDKNETRRESE